MADENNGECWRCRRWPVTARVTEKNIVGGGESVRPSVITQKCPAMADICKAIPVCPTGAIRYVADARERLGGRIVIEEALCNACGLCVTECCGQAIAWQEEKEEA